MGNFYCGVSDDRLLRAEENVLQYAPLRPDQFKVTNVNINEALQ